MLITESWLDSSIPDSGVAIGDSYNIHRKDRLTPGGGILAYSYKNIPTTRLHDLEEDGKEVMFLLLKCAKIPRPFNSVLVVGVYHPPGQPAEVEKDMLFFLTNAIDSVLRDRPSIGLIVTGDFNHMNLNLLCSRFNLRKVVKAPTRGKNTLDQILTNMSDLYKDVKHLPPLGRSDHQCLLWQPGTKSKIKPYTRKVREMKPANVKLLCLKLNLEEWNPVFDAQCVAILTRHLDDTLPKRSVRIHPTDKPWMTPHIKKELKARQRAHTIGDISHYKKLCDKVSLLISKAKENYYLSNSKDLPAWLLKRFNEELALVVHNIICASIVQCKYPKNMH